MQSTIEVQLNSSSKSTSASLKSESSKAMTMNEAKLFIRKMAEEAKSHRAVAHPYLERLQKGSLPNPRAALKDLSFQYLAYSDHFIRYLTATISLLPTRSHRSALVENLREEAGHVPPEEAAELKEVGIDIDWVQGVPHPELYIRYLDALGMDEAYRRSTPYAPEATIWRDLFLSLCKDGSPAQALGAIGLGTESVVKYIYQPILKAIKTHLPVEPRDRVFFDLHALLDDEHGEILMDIAAEYAMDPMSRQDVARGMEMALHIRAAFFDGMLARAMKMQTAH